MLLKQVLPFLFFFCAIPAILAQSSQTIYFNEAGETTIKSQASYYSTITQNKKDTLLYTVETYFNSGNRKESGTYQVKNFPVAWKKLYQANFLDAVKEGFFKEYYDNQQLEFEGKFKQGIGEGKHQRWYSSGQLLSEIVLVGGKEEGKVTSYYQNGTLSTKYKAVNGVIEGELIEYYADGRKRAKATFDKGVLVGDIIYYDSKEEEGPKKKK